MGTQIAQQSTRQCAPIWSENLQLPYASKLEAPHGRQGHHGRRGHGSQGAHGGHGDHGSHVGHGDHGGQTEDS